VDLKCDASGNLYVLSHSTATVTEYDPTGSPVRSIAGVGSTPSGLDVDISGNVYVALTGDNQVARFNPTKTSFQLDGSFGTAGVIGADDKSSGSGSGEFNAPFDVAVSSDGTQIAVSDSGNNRIQSFSTSDGTFISAFGQPGNGAGQFNTPKGLTYDSAGYLYIVDSGNDRVVLAQSGEVINAAGTAGSALGQFQGPVNLGVDHRGIYVADTGNSRVQSFTPATTDDGGQSIPFKFLQATSTQLGLTQPSGVTLIDDSLTEKVYVADTGNNRVILYTIPSQDADALQAVWNNMVSHASSGDLVGASSYFSVASSGNYLQAFLAIGSANAISAISQIGTLTPVSIYNDRAQYYFTSSIDGQTIGFPVEFDKENGIWKILEF